MVLINTYFINVNKGKKVNWNPKLMELSILRLFCKWFKLKSTKVLQINPQVPNWYRVKPQGSYAKFLLKKKKSDLVAVVLIHMGSSMPL